MMMLMYVCTLDVTLEIHTMTYTAFMSVAKLGTELVSRSLTAEGSGSETVRLVESIMPLDVLAATGDLLEGDPTDTVSGFRRLTSYRLPNFCGYSQRRAV
jgi:hypothetical protein